MFWAGLAFLLGDFLFQQSASLPSLYWVPVIILTALIAQRLFGLSGLLLWFLGGWCWGLIYAHIFLVGAIPDECLHKRIDAQGIIVGIPEQIDDLARFEMTLDGLNSDACQNFAGKERIKVSWYQTDLVPQAGESWSFVLKLRKTRNYYNEAGFDYEAYLLDQGIRYRATVVSGQKLDDQELWVSTLRARLSARIGEVLGERPGTGIIMALVIGDRSGLSQEQKQVLLHSGTLHLMAISGLHIGMVAGLGFLLVSVLWRLIPGGSLHIPAPVAAASGGLLLAAVYSFLAGFSLPTQRALIMLCILMLGIMLRRRVSPASVIGAALIGVLLLDPFSVNLPGFWLSFTAVALLLLLLSQHGNIGRLKQWINAQWVLSLGMLPLSLLFFQGVSVAAPLANLLAIQWVGVTVLPLALAGVLLDLAGTGLGAELIEFAAHSIEWLLHILTIIAGFPISWVDYSGNSRLYLLFAAIGIFMVFLPIRVMSGVLGLILLMPVLFGTAAKPQEGAFRLDMLDVGEGLALVIRTREHVLVYDTGPGFRSGFNTGAAVLLPWLRHQGIQRLDTLLISHGDNDHIGGAQSLLKALDVSSVYSSVPERFEQALACKDGDTWVWDQVSFEVLHPPVPWPFSGNNASCVLRISNQAGSVLIAGDIESMGEFRLRKAYPELGSDVLIVPHHGSKTSSTREFLQAVNPSFALVSTGYRNHFGFPHAEVSQRYEDYGISVFNTAEYGTLSLRFPARGVVGAPLGYLDEGRRYWYSATD